MQGSGRPRGRDFCGGAQLTSEASWGFGAFSFSFLLLEISCLMRLAPDTFVLFSFSCELFSCFRGLIGGRGLSSSPLINLSYGRINLKGHQKRGSAGAGDASSIVNAGGVFVFTQYKRFIKRLHLFRSKPAPGNLHTSLRDLFLILQICTLRIPVDTSKNHIIITVHGTWPNCNRTSQ